MEEKDEIQKFDPNTLMQGVKDRIKSEFVSLIPDDHWNQMVKKEVDDFFQEKARGYNSVQRISKFGELVHAEVHKEAQKRIQKYLKSSVFNIVWNGNGMTTCSDKVKEVIMENSGEVLANMIGGMISQGIQNASNINQY